MNDDKSSTTQKHLNFSLGNIGGWILAAVIVAARAFQPNAEQISSWSKASWVWMTLPVWGPIVFGVCAYVVWFICYVLTNAFSRP